MPELVHQVVPRCFDKLTLQAANYKLPDDEDYPEEWRLANRLLDVHGVTRLGEMYTLSGSWLISGTNMELE